TATIPAAAAMPATAADHGLLGALPAAPGGAAAIMGVRQEHPSVDGALLLGTDASLHRLGVAASIPSVSPTSMAAAVDVATLPSGPLRLLADGTTWDSAGTAGPRFSVKTPVRLLAAGDGSLMVIDAAGVVSPSPSGGGQGGGRNSLSTG